MKSSLPDDLGNIDALYDQLLSDETFVETKCYEEVLKQDNFWIIGRKGVGKTALARMIPEREEDNPRWDYIYLANSPDVYFNDLSSDIKNNESLKRISQPDLMFQLWEHFILENCMKIVLKEVVKSPYTGEASIIYKYLKSVGQADLDCISSMSTFFGAMIELMLPAITADVTSIKLGSGEKLQTYFNERHNYRNAVKALKVLMIDNDYKILFLIDDLDENLEGEIDKELVFDFVLQLLEVVKEFNFAVRGKWNGIDRKHLSVKCFVPTDLYSWLALRHVDKARAHKYELNWDKDELQSMLRKRLAELCKVGKMPFDEIMHKYFCEGIHDTFGKSREIYSYIIENTFGRPRDIMNLYIKLSPVLGKGDFSLEVGNKAIVDYISNTVLTIIGEYKFVQPFLADILDSFEKKNAVCSYEDIRGLVADKTDSISLDPSKLKKIIDQLYEIGVFGILGSIPSFPFMPIHSWDVEYCYDRRRTSIKKLETFVFHPIFRAEYSMIDNSTKYLKGLRRQ